MYVFCMCKSKSVCLSLCLFLSSLCMAAVFSRLGPNLACGILILFRVSSRVLLQINRVMPLTNDCLTVPTNNPVSIPFRDAFSKNMHQSLFLQLSVSSFHQC